MHLKPPSDMKVVKWQEKEARLTGFIAHDIRDRRTGSNDAPHTYTLIARSLESPVVRALASLSSELSQANITVKMVMSAIDLFPHDELIHLDEVHAQATTTRLAEDSRLFDAHEQLVMSEDRAWIGDVLRRDPSKRDAYENYCDNSHDAAKFASLGFERIWDMSTPIASINIASLAVPLDNEHHASLALAQRHPDETRPAAGTRH